MRENLHLMGKATQVQDLGEVHMKKERGFSLIRFKALQIFIVIKLQCSSKLTLDQNL